jgi:hypothetical protein
MAHEKIRLEARDLIIGFLEWKKAQASALTMTVNSAKT